MSESGLEPLINTYGPILAEEFIKATVGRAVQKSMDGIGQLIARFRGWGERRKQTKLLEDALASGDRDKVLKLVNEWLGDDPVAIERARDAISIRARADHSQVTGSLDQRSMLAGGDHYHVSGGSGPLAVGPGAQAVQHVYRADDAP